MARYTKSQMAEALRATKGQLTLAARHAGCSYNTMRSWVEKHDDLQAIMQEETDKMGDAVELALYDEAVNKRNTAALIFLAKTKFKHRGYVERTEHTGTVRFEWVDPLGEDEDIGIGADELDDYNTNAS